MSAKEYYALVERVTALEKSLAEHAAEIEKLNRLLANATRAPSKSKEAA